MKRQYNGHSCIEIIVTAFIYSFVFLVIAIKRKRAFGNCAFSLRSMFWLRTVFLLHFKFGWVDCDIVNEIEQGFSSSAPDCLCLSVCVHVRVFVWFSFSISVRNYLISQTRGTRHQPVSSFKSNYSFITSFRINCELHNAPVSSTAEFTFILEQAHGSKSLTHADETRQEPKMVYALSVTHKCDDERVQYSIKKREIYRGTSRFACCEVTNTQTFAKATLI